MYFVCVSMYDRYVFIDMYTYIFTNRYSISSVLLEPYNFKNIHGLRH